MDSGSTEREPTTPPPGSGDTPGSDGEPAAVPTVVEASPAAATGETPGADVVASVVSTADGDDADGDEVDGPAPSATTATAADRDGDDADGDDADGDDADGDDADGDGDDGPAPSATTATAADAAPEPTTGAVLAPPPRQVPAWAKVVAGIAVLAFLGGAYWLGQRGASQPEAPATTATTAAPEGDDPAGTPTTTTTEFELAEYEDTEAGFSFSYPAEWELLELTGEDPTVRLVLSAGGQDSFLVRVEQLDSEVTTDQQLIDINAVTDGAIADEATRVLQEERIELGGLPGYYYLYQFVDEETGLEGAHVHYFLFQGSTVYVLVFQALPTANFEPLVPAFDVVTESFRVDAPDVADDGATTTTAADEPDDGAATTTTAPPTTPTG